MSKREYLQKACEYLETLCRVKPNRRTGSKGNRTATDFFIGIAILTIHFRWNSILAIVFTLLGFGFLIKGITLIIIPNLTLKSGKTSIKYLPLSGIGFVVISLYLGYLSYFA